MNNRGAYIMEYQKYNFKSFNLYTIKTSKFKSCHLEVIFRSPITKEKIIPRKFLMELMSYATLNYPSSKELNIYLEELYNTSFYSFLSRVGGTLLTNFCFDFLNPIYCHKGYLDNILNLVKEIIFNPSLDNKENFKVIKNNILNRQKEALENKRNYAYRQMFKAMDKESFLAYDMLGTPKEVEETSLASVKQEYQKMIQEDYCDIYLIGDLDMDYIASYFDNNFNLRIIKNYDLSLFSNIKSRNKVLIKKEKSDLAQAHLLVGCNLMVESGNNDLVAYLYNYILGGGTIDNKLGMYLRQDNNLCYTASSIYQKYDNVIIIYAGINPVNYSKAVSLIKKALKEMSTKLTLEDVENAKRGLMTTLTTIEDNPNALINNYLFHNIAYLPTIDERKEKLKKITADDVMKLAKKVKINTIYMLSGVEANGKN